MLIIHCIIIEPNFHCLDQVSYFCSEILERCRDHVARDDYRSPVRSRSFSRSPPPRDEREYRRSPSPRENGRSPQDERDFAPSRSLSPRGNNRSLSRSRSYSPR
ncbi:hypothetical protein CMV_012482 [Castanea mollissima]|uniref:Uncharacterized protein n=1 Tax=Castanea mollissima TaxID=60419 RepID=A0A8J4R9G1_9ROSI|nr:hypothetical protein CMV_012482 [Castanea mollissima]